MVQTTRGRVILFGIVVMIGLVGGLAWGFLGFFESSGSLKEGESVVYKYKAPSYGMVERERFVFQIEGTDKMRGMVCEGCVKKIGRNLKRIPGVVSIMVDLEDQTTRVEVEKGKVKVDELRQAIEQAEFKATMLASGF